MTSQPPAKPIAFIDLVAQRRRIGARMDSAIARVIDGGKFIMGPEVAEFERRLAAFSNAAHAVSCANGTDAIALPLLAWNIGPGDAVFCPSFTFAATAEVLPWVGATAVFVDIEPDTYNIDPKRLEAAIVGIEKEGKLRPRAIIAVDLFGQPANYPALAGIAKAHGVKLIADSAQSFGCTLNGKHPAHWADVVTTSFYPAKPLGCYGDGGAMLTNDAQLFDVLCSLRIHGQATAADIERSRFEHDAKYLNVRIGMNSRLDTIQAAVLLEKLTIFADEIEKRDEIARRYNSGLCDAVGTPNVIDGGTSVWAQYTIECPDRDGLAAFLKGRGAPTAVYYPVPIHQQPAYAHYPSGEGGLPVSEDKAGKVISLPMHPYLEPDVQDHIIASVREFVRRNR